MIRRQPPRPQSAAAPWRKEGAELHVLLITSSDGARWIIPKGHIEEGLTPWDSAAKEAWEEAGAVGEVGSEPIGTYCYSKFGTEYEVRVYPLRVERLLESWPEAGHRSRRWAALAECAGLVTDDSLARILGDLPRHLAGDSPSAGTGR